MLLTIIFFTTVQISIYFKRKGKDDKVKTNFKAWFGLIHIRTEIPVIDFSKDLSGTEYQMEIESPNETIDKTKFKMHPQEIVQVNQRLYNWIKKIHDLHEIVKKFLKTIRLDKLEWRSKIGTGDAAQTGVLTGVGWGFKSSLIGLISSHVTLRKIPRIHVQPLFQEKRLETELECMIRLRIGHAIIAGIRILLNLRKRRDNKWQNTQFRA
jgi:hypothetical protein